MASSKKPSQDYLPQPGKSTSSTILKKSTQDYLSSQTDPTTKAAQDLLKKGSSRGATMRDFMATHDVLPGGGTAPKSLDRIKADQLAAQVAAQTAQAQALGGHPPKKQPGLLSRVFDVLSRGQYASAEGVSRVIQDVKKGKPLASLGTLEDLGKGQWAGLSGKKKTSYSKVIGEDLGVKNKVARGVGGFVGDVALDPTTYVGTGVVKSAGKDVLAQVTKQAVEKGVANEALLQSGKSAVKKAAIRDIETKAAHAKVQELLAAGQKPTNELIKEAKDAAVAAHTDVAQNNVINKVLEAQRAERAANPAKVQLKVMGKPVLESKTLAKPFSAISQRIVETKTGDALNKAFRVEASLPGRVHEIDRIFKNVGAAQYESELKAIKGAFTGTSRNDRVAITHALESGDTAALSPKLLDLHDKARAMLDNIATNEVQINALDPNALKDNYVYHVYRNKGAKPVIGMRPLQAGEKYATLAEAKKAGVKPIEDVADMLAHRLAKSHNIQAHYGLMKQITQDFGIDLAEKPAAQALKAKNLITNNVGESIIPKNYYFDHEIANSIKRINEIYTRPNETKQILHLFDSVQGKWKYLVTAPNPGFHLRNLMGDVYNNFLDGVVNPQVYEQAAKMIADKGNVAVRAGKFTFGKDDIRRLYDAMGLRTGFFRAETDVVPHGASRLTSAVNDAVRGASEKREDFTRMAHFIDAIKKEAKKGGTEAEVAQRAAQRVRKFNFDYQDLTPLERSVMKRVVPFYTFIRKNIPLQLEMAATRPGRIAVIPKGLHAIEQMLGQPVGSSEVFPGASGVVPDWIREMYPIRLQGQTDTKNARYWAPDLPIQQVDQFLGGFSKGHGIGGHLEQGAEQLAREGLGASTPALSSIIEAATQRDIQTGAPRHGGIAAQLKDMLPTVSLLSQARGPRESRSPTITHIKIGGKSIPVSERLLNWLTGAGIREVTPLRQRSQLRKEQDVIQAIIAARKKLITEGGQ